MKYISQLKEILKKKDVTQEMLARELGVSFATLNRWLNGKTIPRLNTQKKILHFLKMRKNTDFYDNQSDYEKYIQNTGSLDQAVLSERELKMISQIASSKYSRISFIMELLQGILNYGRNYDWNCGSILQHFNSELIIDALKKIENLPRYYNSIGLAWVLGEINRKDSVVVGYLRDVVRFASDFEASWRAAFSLENLQIEEAIVLLKRSVKIDEGKDLEFYISNIKNKKSIIAVLLKSNTENIQTTIYPQVKEIFLKSKDTPEIINCC